jgi:hypothetical protein
MVVIQGMVIMTVANVFLIITNTGKNLLHPLLSDLEYDGDHLKAVKILRHMKKYQAHGGRWSHPNIGGKIRNLFSIDLEASKQAKKAIDYLLETYPAHIAIGGAWHWESGLQVGTRWELDDEGERVVESFTGGETYEYEAYIIDPETGERLSTTETFIDEISGEPYDVITYEMETLEGVTPIVNTYSVVGTPLYPILPAQLVKFMPKIPTIVDGEITGYTAATELTQVNLAVGQRNRRWD